MTIVRQHLVDDPWLSAVVESSDDAIIVRGLHGNITAWNGAAERLLGFTAAEVIGQPITILVPPDREQEDASVMARIGRGELVDRHVSDRCHQDGRIIKVSVTISTIRDANGIVIGTSSMVRDLEAELAQVQRPVKDDHGLSALIHEATEALTAIINYTGAGQRLAKSPGQEGIPAVLERITEQSNRMIEVVKGMRRFVR
jgi:PAS domain S-box-containing protein